MGNSWKKNRFICNLPVNLKVGLLVGGIAASCAAMPVYSFILARHLVQEELAQVNSIMAVKLELTRSHLAVAEILGGDLEYRKSADEHAGLADAYARAMIEGGATPEGKVSAACESEIRRLLSEVRLGIADLRTMLAGNSQAAPGSKAAGVLERRNDPLFDGLFSRMDRVERLHRIHVRSEFRSFAVETGMFAAFLAGVFVLFAYWLRRYFTETARVEDALRRSEARLQGILDNSGTMVFVKDLEGRYLLVNRRFEALFHVAEKMIIGKTDFDIFPKEYAEAFREQDRRALKKNEPIEAEEIIPQDDGRHTYLSVKFPLCGDDGKPYAVCGIATDITERKKTELALSKVQKLESLGTLAGGIAHDFNNILTAILGNISLAKERIDRGGETHDLLCASERACFSARELSRQLLTFAKGGDPLVKTISLRTLLKSAAKFAARGSNARCVFYVDEDLNSARGDREQLAQVMRNIVINAVQAMAGGGVITIRASNVELGEREVDGLPAGTYVRISVKDEGSGIPEKILPRIFDPFFSTKTAQRGLGLSICHSVVRKHGGYMGVQSEEGLGATFTVHLPAAAVPGAASTAGSPEMVSGSGRVLIMDDDAMVLRVLSRIVKRLGYEVETATDGERTLKAYAEAGKSGKPFDVVIMDLTIPGGMGGKEAIGRLKAMAPEAKAIVSSGYSDDPAVAGYADYGFADVLAKPYQTEEVSAVLGRVIGAHA